MSEIETIPDAVSELDNKPPKRIKKMFPAKVIELIKASPKNEMVRGWVLKVTKQLPPADADTYEKLEEWIESLPVSEKAEIVTSREAPSVSIPISFTRRVSGRCRFRGGECGSDDFILDAGEMQELLEEAIEDEDDISGLIQKVEQKIREDVWDAVRDINWESDDDGYDYDDEEVSNVNDEDYDFSSSTLKSLVKEWIRTNHPEAVEPLGL